MQFSTVGPKKKKKNYPEKISYLLPKNNFSYISGWYWPRLKKKNFFIADQAWNKKKSDILGWLPIKCRIKEKILKYSDDCWLSQSIELLKKY